MTENEQKMDRMDRIAMVVELLSVRLENLEFKVAELTSTKSHTSKHERTATLEDEIAAQQQQTPAPTITKTTKDVIAYIDKEIDHAATHIGNAASMLKARQQEYIHTRGEQSAISGALKKIDNMVHKLVYIVVDRDI